MTLAYSGGDEESVVSSDQGDQMPDLCASLESFLLCGECRMLVLTGFVPLG